MTLVAAFATPALAQDGELCAARPGQTTPPCILAPGEVQIETALGQWTRASDSTSRTDTLTLGSSVLRAGVTSHLEAQIGWTPFGVEWVRDKATGGVDRQSSTGDVMLGLTYGFGGADGPVALQGFVTLPTGGEAIGAGDWGAGVRLPVELSLGKAVKLGLTPEVDAAVNASGDGRNLAYGGAAGAAVSLTDTVQLGVDVSAFRDEDPGGAATLASAGATLAWQSGKNTQLDIGGTAGLTAASPDVTLYLGVVHRF
ncbi:MAG: transporter [Novosphingobium sp.]